MARKPYKPEEIVVSSVSPPILSSLPGTTAAMGYRKVALPRQAGWIINDKRVERIWRREGLKVPNKQPKRGRLWLADGSWSQPAITSSPKTLSRTAPTMDIDEFTHECLAIRVARKLKVIGVIDAAS